MPHHLLLSTYLNEDDEALTLHAGERWQLTVQLAGGKGVAKWSATRVSS